MNAWLYRQYHLPEELHTTCAPCIEESDYSEVGKIIELLKEYRKVPAEAARDVRVFDVEKLMDFLEETVTKIRLSA